MSSCTQRPRRAQKISHVRLRVTARERVGGREMIVNALSRREKSDAAWHQAGLAAPYSESVARGALLEASYFPASGPQLPHSHSDAHHQRETSSPVTCVYKRAFARRYDPETQLFAVVCSRLHIGLACVWRNTFVRYRMLVQIQVCEWMDGWVSECRYTHT